MRNSTGLLALLALAYVGIAEWLSELMSQFPLCTVISEHQHPNNNSANQTCATLFEGIARLLSFIWDNATHDNILAFGTVMIAAFTFTLWRSNKRLWDASERQFKLARDEFISTHRPRLIVRQFQLDPVFPNHKITVHFSVVNVGSTVAIPHYFAGEVALWNGRYFELPGIDPVIKPVEGLLRIANGQRITALAESRFVLSQSQHVNLAADKLIISVIGEITYADELGTEHRTGFRRTYNRQIDKFSRPDDPDDEYCD